MLNREYVHAFGTIEQFNFKLAMQNFNSAKFALECDKDQLGGDPYDLNYGVSDCTPNIGKVRSIVECSKKILADARELRLAASDLEATAKGQFPSELAPVRHLFGEDPRDWFFDFVNIGNCHDCPLHAGLEDADKHIHPCGAKECIIKQLCEMIGYRQ